MFFPIRAKANKSDSTTKHNETTDDLFFRNNSSCGNSTVRATWNCEFWIIYEHLLVKSTSWNPKERNGIVGSFFIMTMQVHTGRLKLLPITGQSGSLMGHPHYSPDLALNDFFLVRSIKRKLSGQRLSVRRSCWCFLNKLSRYLNQTRKII